MRANYAQHGVETYYQHVSSTYRNPHFPGIVCNIHKFFDGWLANESSNGLFGHKIFFDMACGSGEASLVYAQWCSKHGLSPEICASDPYTAPAYNERTSHTCYGLSFRDIADGRLPSLSRRIQTNGTNDIPESEVTSVEWTVCSFALHLIEDNSELFSLLWMLSTRSKWLIVLAPHKKPEIKPGWGWTKWDVEKWMPCSMSSRQGELLSERVHCRVYQSLNL